LDYLSSIHHDGSSRYIVRESTTALRLGDSVTVRLRTGVYAPLERVLLRIAPDGEQRLIEMHIEATPCAAACRWWSASMTLSNPFMSYRFLILTPHGVWWYNARGLQRHIPTDSEDFRLLADYQAPDWVRESVFYQIFPDRFADGDPQLNVREGEYTSLGLPVYIRQWGEPPAQSGWEEVTEYYGGDLIGICNHLDYLHELGVNALYLNPIFTAYTNHRYDVADYYQVDPHLGGNAALAALRRETEQRGMRFILDIVPNHCGIHHPWFQEALRDPNADSADYFIFREHPHTYESWLGVPFLPKLNYRSQALREIMYAGEHGVFRHWLRPPYSVDGWRIDVANMLGRQGALQVGMDVGRGIRQAVKYENPQAYLLGENFFDAASQLQGDCWDGVMNYSGFTNPLLYWLKHFHINQHHDPRSLSSQAPWTTQALLDSWQAYLAAVPWIIATQQFNLLGSHDTLRINNYLEGEVDLIRLAVGVLMTFPGAPSIYYGDEIGLGVQIVGTRQCMLWDRSTWDQELLKFYKALIKLRRSSPALIEGGFQVFFSAEDSFAYLRDAESEYVLVVAHRGPGALTSLHLPLMDAGIPNDLEFVELLTGQRLRVVDGHLHLGSQSVGVGIWIANPK
jgi:alpha-glucosidase